MAGLDQFPSRRFFTAKLAVFIPRHIGFGLLTYAPHTLFIRDVAIFGRSSLLGPPFACRDHFVVVRTSAEATKKVIASSGVEADVLGMFQLTESPDGENSGTHCTLIACSSVEQAKVIAGALSRALGGQVVQTIRTIHMS